MKHITQTILLITLTFNLKGQTKNVPIYFDSKIVLSTIDSLLNKGVTEIIVFQTENKFNYMKSKDSLITIICWKNMDLFQLKFITDNTIYSPINFNGQQVFSFKEKLNCLVKQDEQTLKFVPPLTNRNAIFYFSSKQKGYFEQSDRQNNNPLTYIPKDKNKERLRTAWYKIIYEAIAKENFNFKARPNYDRYKELE